jgi:histidinol-phosphatase (PHP family)
MDYLIGSIHLVFNEKKNRMWFIDGSDPQVWDKGLAEIFDGDIKKGVITFYEQTMNMIETRKPDVIGHFDKIKMHNKDRLFLTTDKWYRDLIDKTLSLIHEHHMVLEINTRGIYKGRCKELFPSAHSALQAQKMGIPIMLNSDAHQPAELNGGYELALSELKKHGIAELVEFTSRGWKTRAI